MIARAISIGIISLVLGIAVHSFYLDMRRFNEPLPPNRYAMHPCSYVGKEVLYDSPKRWAGWAHDIKAGKADAAEIAKLDCELDYVSKIWGKAEK